MNGLNLKINQDVLYTIRHVYIPSGFECSGLRPDRESIEYSACALDLNGSALQVRVAKITPTKVGQFVTLWKRIGNGPTQPFDATDSIDHIVIICRKDQRLGQFVFSKSVLCYQGIVAVEGKGGKRGIRVYPPWDMPVSRQALRTQNWQLDCFLDTSEGQPLDRPRARMLYGFER